MIVKEYCESMERQLAAWQANVRKLLMVAEAVSGMAPSVNVDRQRENLQSLVDDIGKTAELLKQECLVA